MTNNENKLGYKFDGQPAHPELFDIFNKEGDRFSGSPDVFSGSFDFKCPKVGGQKFYFCYDSTKRKKDNGDYWIEFGNRLNALNRTFGGYDTRFELRIIESDGNRFTLRSNGIPLSILLELGNKNNKYEMAFADGHVNQNGEFVEYDQKILTPEEIEIFKSYIRAFEEALEGKGVYMEDLQKLIEAKKSDEKEGAGGCFGVLLLPIVTLGSLLYYFL